MYLQVVKVQLKHSYNDLESLEKYCSCLKCSASYLNSFKYNWSVHCTSCIKAGKSFTKEEYIVEARLRKPKVNNILFFSMTNNILIS